MMMGNKTIYVRSDDLWDRGRARAGDAGISKGVAEALTAWLARSEAGVAGNQRYQFSITAPTDCPSIAFEGRELGDEIAAYKRRIVVYQTKGGKFIVVKGLARSGAQIERYAVYDRVEQIETDESV